MKEGFQSLEAGSEALQFRNRPLLPAAGHFLGVPAALRHAVKTAPRGGRALASSRELVRPEPCRTALASHQLPRPFSHGRGLEARENFLDFGTAEPGNFRGEILARPRPNRQAASCPNAVRSEGAAEFRGARRANSRKQDARPAGLKAEPAGAAGRRRDAPDSGSPDAHGPRPSRLETLNNPYGAPLRLLTQKSNNQTEDQS